ncbi:MAG TPA: anthranilate synthase component I [Kofleriaceae bacterium]|nr:anthranilate synthase component I [Kofleriaceae bacterium]
MYTPSREEFVAAAGRGNLIPVYRELLADSDTPVSAYAALGGGEHSFLLESVVGGTTWAAYSFVGIAPRAVVRWKAGTATVTWYDVDAGGPPRTASWATPDPTAALAEVLGELRPVVVPGLPRFWGGAVGWIAYDCVRAFEELPARARPGLDLPSLCMVVTDTLVIFDNLRQTLKIVATPYVARPERAEAAYERACARIDAIVAALRAPRRALPALEPPVPGDFARAPVPPSSFTQDDFCTAVERVKDYILAGDAFQVVLSQRFSQPAAGARPLDVYRALRVINPSPYMFHLEFPEARVTGASPETLVRLSDGRVELRPIAGTRPRGATAAQDDRLAAELLADPKECAEHLMLIDLGRNDVGRVAATGSVHVAEQMAIERYSHVMHMSSHIVGTLAPGRTWLDVLRAAFPAGTLSGAPKIRAMEIIDELEPHQRGIYGGAVGYVSYTGNLDLAIAIRTLVSVGDTVYVQAGAGLVADSVPETEYEETVNKARAVLRAVAMARTATDVPAGAAGPADPADPAGPAAGGVR